MLTNSEVFDERATTTATGAIVEEEENEENEESMSASRAIVIIFRVHTVCVIVGVWPYNAIEE